MVILQLISNTLRMTHVDYDFQKYASTVDYMKLLLCVLESPTTYRHRPAVKRRRKNRSKGEKSAYSLAQDKACTFRYQTTLRRPTSSPLLLHDNQQSSRPNFSEQHYVFLLFVCVSWTPYCETRICFIAMLIH